MFTPSRQVLSQPTFWWRWPRRLGMGALAFQDCRCQIAWLTTLTTIVLPFALFFLTFPPCFFSFPLFTEWLDGPSPEIHEASAANWSSHMTHPLHCWGQTIPTIKISILAPTSSGSSSIVFPLLSSPTGTQTGTQTVLLPTVPIKGQAICE
jgi:hypothetical protein